MGAVVLIVAVAAPAATAWTGTAPARQATTAPAAQQAATPAAAQAQASPLPRYQPTAEELAASYQRAGSSRPRGGVYKAQIRPHWFADNHRFWYRNDLRGGQKEFIVVDAQRGTRLPAFDHEKLAAALSKASGQEYTPTRLPFQTISLVNEGAAVRFRAGDATWECNLSTYQCVKTDAPPPPDEEPERPPFQRGRRPRGEFGPPPDRSPASPDGKWTAFVKDHNVWVRAADGKETQLSQDGSTGNSYGMLAWSPDSAHLVACRIEPGDQKEVYRIESSPRGGGRAVLHSRPYALPGDKFTAYEINVFDVPAAKQIKPDVERVDFGTPRFRWKRDGRHLTYMKVDRGHQRLRVIEVDAQTGQARNIIDEKSQTFIWTAHTENLNLRLVNWLEKTDEIIYVSESDGWRHLYLVDAEAGQIKNQITQGPFVIRGIDRIDEEQRQIWFHCSGYYPDQDPYLVHYGRVNFDGSDLVMLTVGNGNHSRQGGPQFSPGGEYFIDTYSRVDMPPVSELRRTSDGKLICDLERADVSELVESGWRPPEVFVAKGRDGQTDILGFICRPANFDPNKKYPVIEDIYAGPQGSFVPKSFSPFSRYTSLTELGFIVAKIDGMGTANRSKVFHDACWKNLKDAGLPDRILWHQAVAAKYPQYDIERVGIYGGSAGGQNATAAVLFHGDFYDAAVSACGCHDNRMDKASWNEQWMGYPVGPQYAECSNIENAHRLRGKLMLIVGEMDDNVPPESTLRLADALIKAGKDFDLVFVPGAGHGMGGSYGQRRMQDFFVRHLLAIEPPDRNASQSSAATARPTESARPAPQAAARPEAAAGGQPRPSGQQAAADAVGGSPTSASAEPLDMQDLATPSELRGLIERYSVDRGSVGRSLPPNPAERDELLRAFHQSWKERLAALDFEALSHAGQVDHVLFNNYLDHELRDLELRTKVDAEAALLVPFGQVIYELEESRRKLVPQDWSQVAGTLTALARQISDARRLTERGSGDQEPPTRKVANRAAALVDNLRNTLRNWHSFYDGYDPLYTWWMNEPYQAADTALQNYATYLRQRLGGGSGGASGGGFGGSGSGFGSGRTFGRPGGGGGRFPTGGAREEGGTPQPSPPQPNRDGSDILGEPIGREALLSELAYEMIPYSPEELLELALRELAWCEEQMRKAAREMGHGDDWKAALEAVKNQHVAPGAQPELIQRLALEAIEFVTQRELVTVPPLCRHSWRITMMSPERQLVNPFFTGGETISVSFPTNTMPHEAKLMSMRGNNIHFARATVHHELIPGHHLQGYMTARYNTHRALFSTAFWTEGWALYWEMLLWDLDFAQSPQNRIGMLFWRMHRCARIIFSLKFHLEQMTPRECIEFLVDRVGHERDNAAAEVRRSFETSYGPLYQAAYMLGGLQFRKLHDELVQSGKMTNRQFHDAILKENRIPVEMVRANLTQQPLTREFKTSWRFYDVEGTPAGGDPK